MIRLLIVEDDLNKKRRLRDFVESTYSDIEISTSDSFQKGLKAALLDKPDLILLDMSMPTYSLEGHGGRERRYAGRQILQRLRYKNSPCKVVVITQFEQFGDGDEVITVDELARSLRESFDERYLGLVRYQAADTAWQGELKQLLDQAVEHEL